MKQESEDERFRKRYPSAEARRKADEAIDKLDVHCTMAEFIDTWIAAYKKEAGDRS